jgi:hypothetical protein
MVSSIRAFALQGCLFKSSSLGVPGLLLFPEVLEINLKVLPCFMVCLVWAITPEVVGLVVVFGEVRTLEKFDWDPRSACLVKCHFSNACGCQQFVVEACCSHCNNDLGHEILLDSGEVAVAFCH